MPPKKAVPRKKVIKNNDEIKQIKKVQHSDKLNDVLDQFNDSIRIDKKGPTMDQLTSKRKTDILLDDIDHLIPVSRTIIKKMKPLPPTPIKKNKPLPQIPIDARNYSEPLRDVPTAKRVRTRADYQNKLNKNTEKLGIKLEEPIKFIPPKQSKGKKLETDQGIIRIRRPGESKGNKLAIINGIRLAKGYPAFSSYAQYSKSLPKKPRTEAQKAATQRMLNAKKLNKDAKELIKKKK